jgi:hypothetical protein
VTTLRAFALTFAATWALLWVVFKADTAWQRRKPPADPGPHTPSPQGQRLSGSAGTYPDSLAP